MSEKTYRVIQWMTGDVGQVGVRHFSDNPTFDLVAVLVHDKEKVGKDAGEIAGIPPTGVIATDDIEAVITMDADCVFTRRSSWTPTPCAGSCVPARTSSPQAASSTRHPTSPRTARRFVLRVPTAERRFTAAVSTPDTRATSCR